MRRDLCNIFVYACMLHGISMEELLLLWLLCTRMMVYDTRFQVEGREGIFVGCGGFQVVLMMPHLQEQCIAARRLSVHATYN